MSVGSSSSSSLHVDGQQIYGLSDYTQLRGALIAEMTGSLRAEAGVVLQYGQGVFDGSFLMKLVWGQPFPVPVLKRRERRATATEAAIDESWNHYRRRRSRVA